MITTVAAPLEVEAAGLLGDLVAIPSVNPAFRLPQDPVEWFGERAKAMHVAAWLSEAGLRPAFQQVQPGRPNVIARLKGRTGTRHLLLECHLDTVQVTGMADPFRPMIRNGRLHGRGAVDDGGCVVAMMLAMRALQRDPPAADVTFLGAMDEESGFAGIRHFLAQGEQVDGGIAGEPTSLRLVSACKGCVRWRIEVTGRAAHSSIPDQGIDAIAGATALLAHLQAVLGPRLAARHHPLVGGATMVCTMIEGGQGVNTVAERCVLTFDRRILPGETGMEAWQEVRAIAEAFLATRPAALLIDVQPPFIDDFAMEVDSDAAIIAAARAICRAEGLAEEPLGVGYGSDASKMAAAGIPSIVFGPGNIAQAHAADEYVEIAAVVQAARMIEQIARRFGEN
jgi:succinyl-diaminopimelate desuccinylase